MTCTILTQHTHNGFYSHHASKGPCDSCFFPYFSITYQKLPQVGQKQNVDSFKKKKNGERAQQTGFPFKRNKKKSTLYSQSNTEKIHDRLQTLFGPSHLWDAGQSISISIPWVCNSLHNKVAFSLDYKPPYFFSKHGVNRIPWRVSKAGQECTAQKLIHREAERDSWQATVATALGQTRRANCSHSFQFGSVWFILSNSW